VAGLSDVTRCSSRRCNQVIFANNKAYIGSDHGKSIGLAASDEQKIKSLAEKYGVWYEGAGGDIAADKKMFGDKSAYKGSWDDVFSKSIKDYPHEFLYTVFTNIAVNKQADSIEDPKKTLFESIMNAQKKVGYFKDRRFNSDTLRMFLKSCSESGRDFLAMSQQKATASNVMRFLKLGEQRMWPDNWAQYPNPAGKLMRKAEDMRIRFLKDAPPGVYVVGKDHLKLL